MDNFFGRVDWALYCVDWALNFVDRALDYVGWVVDVVAILVISPGSRGSPHAARTSTIGGKGERPMTGALDHLGKGERPMTGALDHRGKERAIR
ncbi:hypothetical protein CJJ17_07320 [Gordonia polyisoprenivorans]|nr:hypothetical protein CJJ17_07320 [Gordonia polyisoprenivorans]